MIPNLNTDLFNFTNAAFSNASPFIAPTNFDPSSFGSLVSLPTDIKLPSVSTFQKQMMQTILGANGRAEIFTNPHSSAITSATTKLSSLIVSDGIDPAVTSAAQDLQETLFYFQDHTDRLSGVIEETADTAQYPTFERALSVGSALNHASQVLDNNPDNSSGLNLFSSMFAGKQHLSNLTDILNGPTSAISAAGLAAISTSLIGLIENDVNSYTAGLQKLKKISIANIAFGAKDKQAEGGIVAQIASDYTKGLFSGHDDERNAAQVAATVASLQASANRRANTVSFATDFKDVTDLLKAGGLFEGIALTLPIWNKLKTQYPVTKPGTLNQTLWDLEQAALNKFGFGATELTQEILDSFFKNDELKGTLLRNIQLDWLSRGGRFAKADLIFSTQAVLGSVNHQLAVLGYLRGVFTPTENFIGIEYEDQTGKILPVSKADFDATVNAFQTNTVPPPGLFVNVLGFHMDFPTYIGQFMYLVPDNPTQTRSGSYYWNGTYVKPNPGEVIPVPPAVLV